MRERERATDRPTAKTRDHRASIVPPHAVVSNKIKWHHLTFKFPEQKGKKLRWYDCMEEIKAAMNCMLLGMDHATTGEATDGISSFNT